MASAVSFQGLSSGIQTDQLVAAILQSESGTLNRLQDRQTRNTLRTTALTSLKTNMTLLASSLASLSNTSFDARSVSSTDANGTYATATAAGAAAGTYDLQVARVATKGRISPTLDLAGNPTNLAVADPLATPVFTGASATFAVQGTDGTIKTLTLGAGSNSLNGLRDAINSSGAGVVATVVNTGKAVNPYQLVVTAKDTGTGTTGGLVTLADVTAGGAVNTLGITAGTVNDLVNPTTLTGGLQSATAAVDALFTLNGIELTRKSNVVTDAVEGMTITLKQGNQTGTTTFTVAQDKGAVTTALQDVISKFNALLQAYKNGAAVTTDSSGNKKPGVFTGDSQTRGLLEKIRGALTGVPAGLPGTAPFQGTADLGIKTNPDGTLSLDVTKFQAALDQDPAAVKRIFAFTGSSTNSAVSFASGGAATVTGDVAFDITSYTPGGSVSGTFTVGGVPYSLTGTNGVLQGGSGTPLEGLILNVQGTGTGTLTLTRGVAQAARDAVSEITTAVTGSMSKALQRISDDNRALSDQIYTQQQRLAKRKEFLQAEFSRMESVISQLQSAGSSLTNLG
ncbi:MAG: flagellar filament capping protein FliD [Acidobacteria bacterium]|nr:flagellar filament capping protein FliD [Acidobacteriota bacterium]